MRFVPIKEEMQQEVLVLHRVREMLILQRTQLINSIRRHLAEFGIVAPNRVHNIGLLTKLVEDEEFDELPSVARHALRYLVEQLREVKTKLLRIDRDIIRIVKGSDACCVTARLLPPVETRPRDVRHVFSDIVNDVS